jgi:hypothetical protein
MSSRLRPRPAVVDASDSKRQKRTDSLSRSVFPAAGAGQLQSIVPAKGPMVSRDLARRSCSGADAAAGDISPDLSDFLPSACEAVQGPAKKCKPLSQGGVNSNGQSAVEEAAPAPRRNPLRQVAKTWASVKPTVNVQSQDPEAAQHYSYLHYEYHSGIYRFSLSILETPGHTGNIEFCVEVPALGYVFFFFLNITTCFISSKIRPCCIVGHPSISTT